MKRPTAPHLALALTAVSVLAYVSFLATREVPRASRVSAPTTDWRPEPQTLPVAPLHRPLVAASSRPASVPTATERFDEAALMAELRDLRMSAPAQALSLAQQANISHPDSPGAAERTWIIVRSLEDLQRFHEARDVAQAMRDRYPGTSWTNDVERHVLVHPLGHPSREAQQAALGADTPAL